MEIDLEHDVGSVGRVFSALEYRLPMLTQSVSKAPTEANVDFETRNGFPRVARAFCPGPWQLH